MSEKPDSQIDKRPANKQPIPDVPNDGFPVEKDVSDPPPGSDVKEGLHKEDE